MVIFDLGGVVIDIPDGKYVRYLRRESGISENNIMQINSEYSDEFESGKLTLSQFEKKMGKALDIKPSKVCWLKFFKKEARLNRQVAGIAVELSKSYPVAILSNTEGWRFAYAKLHMLKGIMHIFKYVFVSYKIRALKPERRIYDYVIRKVGLKPSEILFIDNLVVNVEGARATGIKSVTFTTAQQLKLDLKKFGIKIR